MIKIHSHKLYFVGLGQEAGFFGLKSRLILFSHNF